MLSCVRTESYQTLCLTGPGNYSENIISEVLTILKAKVYAYTELRKPYPA